MTPSNVVDRARAMYEERIRAAVEPQYVGKYIAIDVNSADYVVGDDYLDISKDLHGRRPDASVAILRIGHRTVGRIGFRMRRVQSWLSPERRTAARTMGIPAYS